MQFSRKGECIQKCHWFNHQVKNNTYFSVCEHTHFTKYCIWFQSKSIFNNYHDLSLNIIESPHDILSGQGQIIGYFNTLKHIKVMWCNQHLEKK